MSRRRSATLSTIEARYAETLTSIEEAIDQSDALASRGFNEVELKSMAKSLQSTKENYCMALSELANVLRSKGHTDRVVKLYEERARIVNLFGAARDALREAAKAEHFDSLSLSSFSTTASWVAALPLPKHLGQSSKAPLRDAAHPSDPLVTSADVPLRRHSVAPFPDQSVRRAHSVDNVTAAQNVAASGAEMPFCPRSTSGGDRRVDSVSLSSAPDRGVDALARLLAVRELKATHSQRYDGRSVAFPLWKLRMQQRLKNLSLSPLEEIDVLLDFTVGEPKRVVETYSLCSTDPSSSLRAIWSELGSRFGSSASISKDINQTICDLPPVGTGPDCAARLREMSDLCQTILAFQSTVPDLSVLDTSAGMQRLRDKLPAHLARRWRTKGRDYELAHGVSHPPFSFFCKFLKREAEDESASSYDLSGHAKAQRTPVSVSARRTSTHPLSVSAARTTTTLVSSNITRQPTDENSPTSRVKTCPVHQSNGHSIIECQSFLKMPASQRKTVVFRSRRCFRCLGEHRRSDCRSTLTCGSCSSDSHHSLLHLPDQALPIPNSSDHPVTSAGGQPETLNVGQTLLSLTRSTRQSCGKTLPVRIWYNSCSVECFVILDDQSSSSFVSPEICRFLGCPQSDPVEYSLSTLDGVSIKRSGHIVDGLRVSPLGHDGTLFELPHLVTCDTIPDTSSDFASSDLVRSVPSVSAFADRFPTDPGPLPVFALFGRDASILMFSKPHTTSSPFVVETPLGWALVGSVDPASKHLSSCSTNSASVLCCQASHFSALRNSVPTLVDNTIITVQPGDEEPGLSQEDRQFLKIASKARVCDSGHIEIPLPRRSPPVELPNNKAAVLRRMSGSVSALRKRPEKLADCVNFVQKMLDHDQVEQVPTSEIDNPSFYIPVFPVTHPKKLKTRLVFDSAALFSGVSLNSALLQGPDNGNRLFAVLTRFREGNVAVAVDVESMFHCFRVPPRDFDSLRFLWFSDNDPSCPLVPFRAKVHIFGNTSSPSIATYALRFAASFADETQLRAREFVEKHFYVDDGLLATHSVDDAVSTVRAACGLLAAFHIRLHKVLSNSRKVLECFPLSELALSADELFTTACDQHALGVRWNVQSDRFSVVAPLTLRTFSRRGLVALCNSVFDPLGLVCPVVLGAKLLFRDAFSETGDWDDPLPERFRSSFERCVAEFGQISSLHISRSIFPTEPSVVSEFSLHVFSDASTVAIGFVIYAVSHPCRSPLSPEIRFVTAGNKVAPKAATTVPRLELCAAVSAVRAAQAVVAALSHKPDRVVFYTDSRVVLGYLGNVARRFSVYVSNRISAVLSGSSRNDWRFVSTSANPADLATRVQTCDSLKSSRWTEGPSFLFEPSSGDSCFQNFEASDLPETLSEKTVLVSARGERARSTDHPFDRLFCRLRWRNAVNVVVIILTFLQTLQHRIGYSFPDFSTAAQRDRAILLLVIASQRKVLSRLRSATYRKLSPIVTDSVVRVGGRLGRAPIEFGFRHPVVIDGSHSIAKLLVDHFHCRVGHQGRFVTASAIRDAGYFILGCSRVVRSCLANCYTCRRIRFAPRPQLMSDLPPDRLESRPPFEQSGMDIFGPYLVPQRATRLTSASMKVWVLLFCCLYSRAIHLEPLMSLSTQSFVNAFRRFVSLRGGCRLIRCDRGSNFVGAANLFATANASSIASDLVRYVPVEFRFNPAGASNFGGVFESKIRSVRRVLDQTIALSPTRLSFEDLTTFISEAASVVNATPYSDAVDCELQPISPSVLLFAKRFHSSLPLPEPTDADLAAYGLNRWRRIQYLSDEFARRWKKEYLANLIARNKWTRPSRNFIVGDVVVLAEKSSSRYSWPLARVTQVERANDGYVRRVAVATSSGRVLERAANTLVLLVPADSDQQTHTLQRTQKA